MTAPDEEVYKAMKLVQAKNIVAENRDKLCRKWLLDTTRAMMKTLTSLMQTIDVLKDSIYILRDFLEKLEITISESEGEL